MSSAPLNVAVLGMGMSATVFHIPFVQALKNQFALKTIYERSATETKSAARDAFPGIKVVNTLEGVLDDASIDLVYICTINDTHYDFAKAALNAGKHVVVEKPLTPTSQEAHELAALAKEKNLVLAVYQNRRFDSDFLTVKKLIDEGKFGELSEFQSNFDRFKGEAATTKMWKEENRPGSGAAYDLGSHLIDQILVLFGKPQRVTGIVRNSRAVGNPDVPDSFLIHLHYDASTATGRKLPLLATARGSILSHVSPQLRFSVKGAKASFVKHGLDVQEDQLKKDASHAVSESSFGVEPESLAGQLYTAGGKVETIKSETGSYISWFKNVAEAIQLGDRNRLYVTPEAAALTIEIIEAATKSSREGKTIDL